MMDEHVDKVLQSVRAGDVGAEDRLFALVYGELRRMASRRMSRERPGHTLQTTALVHEAYLRLTGENVRTFENRNHFFAAAAEAMRRILIDRARRKQSLKHGGDRQRVLLQEECAQQTDPLELLALDEAMDRLARENPRSADVVKYHFYLELTVKETAEILGISPRTVDSDWAFAKAWFARHVADARE